MDRDRRFPAPRRARPGARGSRTGPATRDPEPQCRGMGGGSDARDMLPPAFVTGHGCRVAPVYARPSTPCEHLPCFCEGGTRPQRFIRAPSVPAFRMPRVTAGVLCRVTDAATNQRLGARAAKGTSGGSVPGRSVRRRDPAAVPGAAWAGGTGDLILPALEPLGPSKHATEVTDRFQLRIRSFSHCAATQLTGGADAGKVDIS